MEIINDAQLAAEMIKIANSVISIVSDKILFQLQEDIRRDVYSFDYFPNKYYVMGSGIPTFGFFKAWKWDVIKADITSATREMFYDFASMMYDPENYIHGSPDGGDRREELADDLNVSGIAKNSDFGSKERAPYFDNFIREMFTDGQLEKWFSQELSKFGFIRS